jgi:hypothetical protein
LLFSQSSPRATLTPTACRCDGRYILTLRDVGKHTVWFSDRPNRDSGHMSTRTFTRDWKSFGFSSDRPNAALSAIDASGRRDTDIVELTHPRYGAKRDTMRYLARNVPFQTGPLKVKRGADGFIPGRFRDVSLFIDDAVAPVIDGCILHARTYCQNRNFSYASLSGIDLSDSTLYTSYLAHAVLTNSNLRNALLAHSFITDADLTGADLTGADLQQVDFSRSNLTRATFTGDNIAYSSMNGANLTAANLSGAYMGAVDLRGANLIGANLTGTQLYYARYCNTTMPNGSVNNSSC